MSAENISYDLKRFAGIKRDYSEEDVERLRGSIKIEYSILIDPLSLSTSSGV